MSAQLTTAAGLSDMDGLNRSGLAMLADGLDQDRADCLALAMSEFDRLMAPHFAAFEAMRRNIEQEDA